MGNILTRFTVDSGELSKSEGKSIKGDESAGIKSKVGKLVNLLKDNVVSSQVEAVQTENQVPELIKHAVQTI